MSGDDRLVRCDREGRVALVVLDRPDRLNAIGSPTLDRLDELLAEVGADSGIGAVVITGEGKAFSAGADISELSTFADGHAFARFIEHMTDVYDRLERLPKPTIAAVEGVAFGGGFELALSCDLRVIGERARLGLPEVKLGLLPGGGGTQRLARLLPATVAKMLLMTGRPLHADAALRHGVVNEVVSDGEAAKRALELAAELAEGPPLALAAAKRLIDNGRAMPLQSAIAYERETVAMLFGSADGREGVQAFLDKRPPAFQGR